MLDIGDPAFKLFGKTIPLVSSDEVSGDSNNAAVSSEYLEKGQAEQKSTDESFLKEDPFATSATKDEPDADNQTASRKGSISSEDQNSPNSTDENSASESDESKNSAEESMKKPDKILPCPRCNSMDTKFCYYNNYNVNQPRHFCKSCQRYWTAGGTMRNVPVGAGRRKNKSASSNYCRHLSISEALPSQPDSGLKMNGTVLNFGADSPSPLCDSSIGEKKVLNGTQNGFSHSMEEGGVNPMKQIPHNMQVFPGFQLVPLATPGFFPPMPIYPAPYWNMPWVVSPCSPTLGKHSREEDTLTKPTDVDSPRVLVPKTLRIDDPEEAAKSSIWTTLGIKKVEPVGNGGFFQGLQSKGKDKNHKMKGFPVLNSNPAALARSLSFQETA